MLPIVDIHSHIIPGVDDGPNSPEITIKMLKIAADDGIETIFATPHYEKGRFEIEKSSIKDVLKALNTVIKEENINIQVLQGNEVRICENITELYREDRISTLNNSRYMLIELPSNNIPGYALDKVYELGLIGITPIIAHPERNLEFMHNPLFINEYIEEGCLFQLNGESLTGRWGNNVQKFSEKLLKQGIISFIGSDAHGEFNRKPELSKIYSAIENKYRVNVSQFTQNAKSIICDASVTFQGEMINHKKSFFNIFFKK